VCCSQCAASSQPFSLKHQHLDMFTCVYVCIRVFTCVYVCCKVFTRVYLCCSVLRCAEVCCSVLQCVAVRCSALQCVAVRCTVLHCVVTSQLFFLRHPHLHMYTCRWQVHVCVRVCVRKSETSLPLVMILLHHGHSLRGTHICRCI